jgi:streptogramin lyase
MKTGTARFATVALLAVFASVARAQPPQIVAQPTNEVVLAGGTATFSVAVAGTGPFAYQWQFNGANLPNDIITTVAGGHGGYSGDGGAATNASLNGPSGVALDSSGNVFIADQDNWVVRKVATNGMISTFAGEYSRGGGYSGDGGAATNADLAGPSGVAVDAFGNLFIADAPNDAIRKVDIHGIITTFAGSFSRGGGYSGDGGAATNASLNNPSGVAVDPIGNIFIADAGNNVIRKVDTNGVITTVAGNGLGAGTGNGDYSGDGGAATNASLNGPHGVAVDALGEIFIADLNNDVVRRVGTDGIITTVVGDGIFGYSGDGGMATNATLNAPSGVAVDASGELYIADVGNEVIRKLDTNGVITTVAGNGLGAGTGNGGSSGDGGAATNASLNLPSGVAVDATGSLLIADRFNDRIREVDYGGLHTLTLNNISEANGGNFQVVITASHGSVTSAVAKLTVIVPPVIAMSPPVVVSQNLLVGFNLTQGSSPSFTLLQSPAITGPWTTNASAVLTTNAQSGGYEFTLPVPASTEFYRVRSQ